MDCTDIDLFLINTNIYTRFSVIIYLIFKNLHLQSSSNIYGYSCIFFSLKHQMLCVLVKMNPISCVLKNIFGEKVVRILNLLRKIILFFRINWFNQLYKIPLKSIENLINVMRFTLSIQSKILLFLFVIFMGLTAGILTINYRSEKAFVEKVVQE